MSKKREFLVRLMLCFACCLCLLLAACAEKTTGGGGDDDTADDDTAASGVGSLVVYLNMVPVTIGDVAETQTRTLYNADGETVNAESALLSDFVVGITEFTGDAPNFTYEFIDGLENSILTNGGALVAFDDLAKAAFYGDAEGGGLCIGWTETGHAKQSLCGMEKGALVTHPVEGKIDLQTIEGVDGRTGDQPTHLGEEAAIVGVTTVGTGVMVSGSYVKTFVQQNGYGVKIFADMSATVDDLGYDGQLFKEICTFEGDEVFAQGRITLHDGMIEFVPKSGYHLAVLSTNNPVDAPLQTTIDDLLADPYRYAGALVRLDDLEMVDINPDDPTTDWPAYGTKSKDIRVSHAGGGAKIGMPIYEGTGIPGSFKPDAGFSAVGAFNIEGDDSYDFYPRKIEDINPTDERLAGQVRVSIVGEDRSELVDMADLPASLQRLAEGEDAVPVVSLAEVTRAAGVARNWKNLTYKPVAYDDRKPFDTSTFDQFKSGVLYQGTPSSEEEPDPLLNSYFWEGMNLSEIYYLVGVTQVQAFRPVEPPPEGDAEHGEGITLQINGKKYAINFDTLPHTTYDGKDAIAIKEFISDQIVGLYTMDGSFTNDQIKKLYDYRLVSYDGEQDATVRVDDLANGFVVLDDIPYTVFPDLGGETRIEDIYVIDMRRYIQVNTGAGDPTVIYLQDCPTEDVDVGDGVIEPVVFYRSVLEAAGVDTSQGMYLFNFDLVASDDFVSNWTYAHGHLVDMYIRPLENRGYTVDPDLAAYGGRVSTKAIYEIRLTDVPQEAPSIQVDVNGTPLWGADANSCEGCHFKNGAVQLPIDCFSCHAAP